MGQTGRAEEAGVREVGRLGRGITAGTRADRLGAAEHGCLVRRSIACVPKDASAYAVLEQSVTMGTHNPRRLAASRKPGDCSDQGR